MDTAQKPTLRQRKKTLLRDTIVRTAITLFSKHGFDAVSVDEIANKAMCSRSTFNRYFGSKEDVLFPGAAESVAQLKADLDASLNAPNKWDAARAILIERLEFFLGAFKESVPQKLWAKCLSLWNYEATSRRRHLELGHEWEQLLADYFAASAPKDADHVFRSQLLAMAMIAVQRTAMIAAIHSDRDPREMAEHLFDQLAQGIDGQLLIADTRQITQKHRRSRSESGKKSKH